MPRYKIEELAVCWNDNLRKTFVYHRWEFAKELQFFLREHAGCFV